MKFCPFCGADQQDGSFSFCPECGKALPKNPDKIASEEAKAYWMDRVDQQYRDPDPEPEPIIEEELPPEEPIDTYDGYYDDIEPESTEEESIHKSNNKDLVKKIVLIVVGALIVVGVSIAVMYLL